MALSAVGGTWGTIAHSKPVTQSSVAWGGRLQAIRLGEPGSSSRKE